MPTAESRCQRQAGQQRERDQALADPGQQRTVPMRQCQGAGRRDQWQCQWQQPGGPPERPAPRNPCCGRGRQSQQPQRQRDAEHRQRGGVAMQRLGDPDRTARSGRPPARRRGSPRSRRVVRTADRGAPHVRTPAAARSASTPGTVKVRARSTIPAAQLPRSGSSAASRASPASPGSPRRSRTATRRPVRRGSGLSSTATLTPVPRRRCRRSTPSRTRAASGPSGTTGSSPRASTESIASASAGASGSQMIPPPAERADEVTGQGCRAPRW